MSVELKRDRPPGARDFYKEQTMRKNVKVLWSLAMLNLVLVIALMLKVMPGSPMAHAQARRPADYLMVPASIAGAPTGVMFLIDTSNGILGGARYDEATKRMSPMPPIDLTRIFAANPGVGPGPGPTKGGR